MAATSYSTLPSNTHIGPRSHGDPHHLNSYGTYNSGIGLVTAHPYQYQTNNDNTNHSNNQQLPPLHPTGSYSTQQQPSSGYSNSQTSKTNARQIATNNKNNNNTGSYATLRTTQPPPKNNISNQQTTQHRPPAPVDNQHHQSQSNLIRSEHQIPKQQQQQQKHHQSQPPPQSNLTRSEHQISKTPTAPPPAPVRHRSPSNEKNKNLPETVSKSQLNPLRELKPTKSSTMRAAANKKKEENREQKRKDRYFPSKLKSQPTNPLTDVELSDTDTIKRNKKQSNSLTNIQNNDTEKQHRTKNQSHSLPNQRKSRRDHHHHHTDDNDSSAGDDDHHHHKRHRSKSQKRATFSDSYLEKHPHLPPLRHGRMPLSYDPYIDYPLPPGHPLRAQYPYYDDYLPYGPYPPPHSRRHLYEDADDIPPYLAPYHDPYDPFFDYEKRKVKPQRHEDHNGAPNGHETEREDGAKSQQSRKSKHKNSNTDHNGGRKSRRRDYEERLHPPHYPPGYYPPHLYDGRDMLELWRQERNDYLKKKFKPTIHDVLYSQQWMKSDSYLENQRRRTLRDAQGYYFPYKKYTLKDYKDLQKTNQQNPFADVNEIPLDRKERAKKRQEYGSLVERQIVDHPGTRRIPPHEMQPRKPWHLSSSETPDAHKSSKRDRALEYAKVQVKYRPVNYTNEPSYQSDLNDDGSNHDRTSKNNQLYDDYDQ